MTNQQNNLLSNPQEDTSAQQQQCHLLQLPSELRNRIYELVLLDNASTVVEVRRTYKTPPLLSTCHQIRSEAGNLYYGSAVFSVKAESGSGHKFVHRSPSGLCILWLTSRAFQASQHVRRIQLDLYNRGTSGWMDVWKPIALQIVRDQITCLKLGEKIVVDAYAGEVGLRSKLY